MELELSNVDSLLKQVMVKVSHSREIAKLKGERFNIFSLLNMENSENAAHSMFLGELLNPNGTHGLKDCLLEWFVKIVNSDFNNHILEKFDCSSAKVYLEKSIGRRQDDLKQGGRVDIAIFDKNGYSIFIENKIYATDQNAQIERYCNYNRNKCIVIYLTRHGGEASIGSRGILVNGSDYYCISYKKDIINWLEQCIKEAVEQPILRETIRQYNNLIKKLTGQLMNSQLNKQVRSLILDNLESSEIIANNFIAAKEDLLGKIRIGLKKELERNEIISSKFIIKEHGKIGDRNSKIWFYHKQLKDTVGIYFGIEPFSGNGVSRNDLFIGIIDINSKHQEYFLKDESNLQINGWWRGVEYLLFENNQIRLSDLKMLKELRKEENLQRLMEELTTQTIEYIEKNEEVLLRICESVKDSSAINGNL